MRTWMDLGIELKHGASGEVDTTCPKCSPERKKRHARCLSVNVELGTFLCHHCGYAGSLQQGEQRVDPGWRKPIYRRPDPRPETDLPATTLEWFLSRGISREVVLRNRIQRRLAYMPQVEDHVPCIVFPYRRNGELVNAKYRDKDKNFRMEGGAERILYGYDDMEDTTIIVEGEIDKLSLEQAGFKNCVSVPDGAPTPEAKNYASKFSFLDDDRVAAVKEWIIAVDGDAPGCRLEEELCRRFGAEKCRRVIWPEGCKDANDVVVKLGAPALKARIESAQPFPLTGVIEVNDLSREIEALYDQGVKRGLSTGWKTLDEFYTVRPGELTIVSGVPNSGKALALDTPVPTPDGWTTMGDISTGDELFDECGRLCRVSHAFDVMYGRPCYRITLSDGSAFIADADHLWITRTDKARRSAIQTRLKRGDRDLTLPKGKDQRWMKTYPSAVTTREISDTLLTTDGRRNHAIRIALPIQLPDADLNVPPYTLGAWLGDGSSACGAICAAEAEVVSAITADGFSVTRMPSTNWGYTVRGLMPMLRALGVLGDKHIPAKYLRASETQRKALLAGLMDTDGHMGADGRCEFCNTNERLARNVFELVASLGLQPRMSIGRATLRGKDCGPKYRVFFTPTFEPFRLNRKAAGVKRISQERRIAYRTVVSVETVESVPVRCISVDSPGRQFLIGKAFVPTHNSNWVDGLTVNLSRDIGWHHAVFSPENQPLANHISRLMEHFRRVPFRDGPTARMTREEMHYCREWLQEHYRFILPESEDEWRMDFILERAAQLVRRFGIHGVVIDPWNELQSTRPERMTETEFVSVELRRLRQFARRHQVHVWLVAHPAKMYRNKDGQYPVPSLYDISGSAHFRNKADNGIVLWRDLNDPGKHSVEIHVQKIRFREVGKVGGCELKYDPATGAYSDWFRNPGVRAPEREVSDAPVTSEEAWWQN